MSTDPLPPSWRHARRGCPGENVREPATLTRLAAGEVNSVPWLPLRQLFDAFADIRGVGLAKMTKALYPKRPALIPMLDSMVQTSLRDDDLGAQAPFAERALGLVRGYQRDLDHNWAAVRRGVVDQVDRNDLRAGDREGHECNRPAFRGRDDAGSSVDQCGQGDLGDSREGERASGHRCCALDRIGAVGAHHGIPPGDEKASV
jgi:Family of unknown function (DUF6308)